jgi:arginine repressor
MNELLLEKYAYKKKKPVLLPYIDNIKLLLEHDATQKSILEYLKNEEGITVSQPYLSKFIKQYIYGDKQANNTQKESTDHQPVKKTPEAKPSSINNSNNSTSNDTEVEKEMSKEDRDAIIEELIKNNQNYLQKSKKGAP